MSETQDDRLQQSVESSADKLDAASVVAYLRDHPDFFVTYADLLTELLLPHESGDAVSLVERQVSLLRDRNIEGRKHLGTLLDAAKTNDARFSMTRDLVLAMLDAPDLITLISSLKAGLQADPNVHAVSVIAFDGTLKPVLGIRSSTRAQTEEKLGNLLGGGGACGPIGDEGAAFLFQDVAAIKSAAVVPLQRHSFRGALALGSTDAEQFSPHTGTLFLQYIGEILSHLLVRNGP